MTPRIAPLEPPHEPAVADELAGWMPPGAGVEPIALFRTLVRNLPLAAAMRPLGKHLLSRRSGLPKRVRELVIDRVCARCGCEYEWGVHVAFFAADAGLDAVTIDATVHAPPGSPDWSADDAPVIALVDELHDGGRIADATWAVLAARFAEPDLLTLVVLVGWYHAIAWVANGARVPLEGWAARFPPG